ncbi:MAG: hypothetical protein RIR51_1332 [Bacteroidota bacterium]
MKKFVLLFLILPLIGFSQNRDSIQVLKEVTIFSFEKNRILQENPDAISQINSKILSINNGASLLNSLNSQPGIRMEERSPGSYRLAIRGSSLRAPYGVRNVKIYWNNLPLTDAGNNTYFNVLDPALFSSILVAKGPNGGVYGSGTGGTILLNTQANQESSIDLNQYYNSIGGFKQNTDIRFGNNRIFVGLQKQKGYREQSDLSRVFLSFEGNYPFRKTGNINLIAFSSKLNYETPGGLNISQYQANPRQARPAAGPNKSAIDQKASLNTVTQFLGINLENQWNNRWAWNWGNVIQVNSIINPSIRNYEERSEPNFSTRAVIHFKDNQHFSWDSGIEYQIGQFNSSTFGNFFGKKDTLQTILNTNIQQLTYFNQVDYQFSNQLTLTASASLNYLNYEFKANELILSPRLSLVYSPNKFHSLVGKISHGFSPPSISEIRPSTGILDLNLKSEKGWNKEVIYRGKLNKLPINWTINAYLFNLNETIVVQTASDGADFYANVGSSIQRGVEANINFENRINSSIISFSFQNSKFKESGKYLPGIANNTLFLTEIIQLSKRVNWTIQFQKTGKMYLNNANIYELPSSTIWNTKLDYDWRIKELKFNTWIYIDNIFDLTYTLGPDLNAFGNRFYNAALGRNISFGTRLRL